MPVGTSGRTHWFEFCTGIVHIFSTKPLRRSILAGESGTVVPLLTRGASAPWCPTHARAGMGGVCHEGLVSMLVSTSRFMHWFVFWLRNVYTTCPKALGKGILWQVGVGPLPLCSQMLLLPLGSDASADVRHIQ